MQQDSVSNLFFSMANTKIVFVFIGRFWNLVLITAGEFKTDAFFKGATVGINDLAPANRCRQF